MSWKCTACESEQGDGTLECKECGTPQPYSLDNFFAWANTLPTPLDATPERQGYPPISEN